MVDKTNASRPSSAISSPLPSRPQSPTARTSGAEVAARLQHEVLSSRRWAPGTRSETLPPRQSLARREGDSYSLLSSPTRSESFNSAASRLTPLASPGPDGRGVLHLDSAWGRSIHTEPGTANASFRSMDGVPEHNEEFFEFPAFDVSGSESHSVDMPQPAAEDAPTVPIPEQQSWQALLRRLGVGAMETGNAALHRVGDAAVSARNAVSESTTAQAIGGLLPSQRIMGAVLGHGVHQAASVFVPTFVREMMAESMKVAFRTAPPSMVLGMQVGVGLLNIGLALVRTQREGRDPDTAARGFHAMTLDQWNQCPDDQKEELRQTQQRMSRIVTLEQIGASLASVGLSLQGMLTGDVAMPADVLAGDIKTVAYSFARDFIQASFSMVGTEAETSGGVSGSHMNSSSLFYGLANVVGNNAWSELPVLGGDTSGARAVLLDRASSSGARSGAWQEIAGASAIKAAINWAVETADWISVTQQEARQSDTVQQLNPRLTGTDYSRLLDQTPARITAITGAGSVFNVLGHLTQGWEPGQQNLLSNSLAGILAGLTYMPIGGSWQAAGAVRAAARDVPAEVCEQPQVGLRHRRPHGRADTEM
ncbi:hypothetical protein [Acidovorax sp. SUPP2539]|uniref:hypothetical protein n=1 Tax=Acidovorax sp. SUPP2539 TaxID=2920878 RepID=UPI0023DE2ED7|nr:hypothetical protein [Acidovorax sp. SUPP2539]GKS89244.1 hypothetical protein AVTE2539_07785 [Acidovorax sp. SUPP2539]